MNQNEDPTHVSLPSDESSRPRHLSGAALKQWYLDHPPLNEEEKQAALRRMEEQRVTNAWGWLVGIGIFTGLCHAFMWVLLAALLGPIAAVLFGVWLTIGRGSLLFRSVIALVVVVCLGWVYAPYRSFLVGCMLLSMILSGVELWGVTQLHRGNTRPFRFSIMDIAGAMLLVACSLVLIREEAIQVMTNLRSHSVQETLLLMLFFSGNSVVASLPVFVLPRHRDGRLFKQSAIVVLLVAPIMELILVLLLFGSFIVLVGVLWFFAHAIGAVLVWSIVFPLETVGAFRDEEAEPSSASEASSGQWEELE